VLLYIESVDDLRNQPEQGNMGEKVPSTGMHGSLIHGSPLLELLPDGVLLVPGGGHDDCALHPTTLWQQKVQQ
jgi:hypothetical protein